MSTIQAHSNSHSQDIEQIHQEEQTYDAKPTLLNWAACVLVGLGPWLYGYDSGIISSIVSPEYTQFYDYFHPSTAMVGTVVAIIYAGAVLGGFGMDLADYIGRRWSIILYSIISIIGCVLQAAAVNMPMMIVGRLVAGLAMGSLTSLATLYQAEISPSRFRGMMGSATKFVNNFGFFTSNWVGYGCLRYQSSLQWRIPLAIQILPPVVLFVGMWFLPESPRYLILKGRVEEARSTLLKLRNKKPQYASAIEAELQEMKVQIEWEHENLTSRWIDLVNTKPNLRRTLVGSMVQGMAVFNGIVVINYYAPTIYTSLGFSGSKVLLINGLWGIPGPLSSGIYMLYGAEHFGRRKPMIIGSIAMACLITITTGAAAAFSKPGYSNEAVGAIGIASMFLFGFSFNQSFGPIAWLYPIEIFPMNLRAKGAGVATACTWAATLVLLQVAPIAFDSIGWKFFIAFIVFNISNAILCYFFCPEVAGLPLEEIGVLFGDDANVKVHHENYDGNTKNEILELEDRKDVSEHRENA